MSLTKLAVSAQQTLKQMEEKERKHATMFARKPWAGALISAVPLWQGVRVIKNSEALRKDLVRDLENLNEARRYLNPVDYATQRRLIDLGIKSTKGGKVLGASFIGIGTVGLGLSALAALRAAKYRREKRNSTQSP